jgi:hypothetical protein
MVIKVIRNRKHLVEVREKTTGNRSEMEEQNDDEERTIIRIHRHNGMVRIRFPDDRETGSLPPLNVQQADTVRS